MVKKQSSEINLKKKWKEIQDWTLRMCSYYFQVGDTFEYQIRSWRINKFQVTFDVDVFHLLHAQIGFEEKHHVFEQLIHDFLAYVLRGGARYFQQQGSGVVGNLQTVRRALKYKLNRKSTRIYFGYFGVGDWRKRDDFFKGIQQTGILFFAFEQIQIFVNSRIDVAFLFLAEILRFGL